MFRLRFQNFIDGLSTVVGMLLYVFFWASVVYIVSHFVYKYW